MSMARLRRGMVKSGADLVTPTEKGRDAFGGGAGRRLPAAVWIDEGENVIDLVGHHDLRHVMGAPARVVELQKTGRRKGGVSV